MNSGLYQRRREMNGFQMDQYLCEGNSVLSDQPSYPMTSHDGLPRSQVSQASQAFMDFSPSASSFNNYSLGHSIPMSQPPTQWTIPDYTASLEDPNNHYYDYTSNITGNEHNGSFPRGLAMDIPRSMPNMFSDNNILASADSYEPSTYMLESNRPTLQSSSNLNNSLTYQDLENTREFGRLSICRSPGPKLENDDVLSFNRLPAFGMVSSASSDEGNSSREMTAVETEDQNVDEPYAKLIYRALMSAPNHAMVLQEIYQWFRDNTLKGSADTKGWMNSIRHNLSMNAAFKKTERKTPGEDTKKSTEWVLEDFAIKDGVQSTTRYRKGTGAKKFIKTESPTLARQVSGRKGGISAKQAKLHRQQRMKDDRRDTQRIDSVRRSQLQSQARSQISQRQRSPLTPPSADVRDPPYFIAKAEPFDVPYEDVYRLEDVSGVCADDGPLFSNGPDAHFHGFRQMADRY